ncbi:hypothetical protein [Streptomyces sp. WAC08241]|uniref:hypothetical protein n=1 Tax=Streptomyces sp. WAC08241 TaxID=2487421 RepID=UPI0021AEB735|nr:hypothetical protein [Streptomyces sp. WAC08241]
MDHRGVDDPRDPGFMLVKRLDPGARPAPPEGYARTVESRDGVVRVRIHAPDGTLAARGQIAPTGATAVADRIETDAAHRRRGLDANVVLILEAEAEAARAPRPASSPRPRTAGGSTGRWAGSTGGR